MLRTTFWNCHFCLFPGPYHQPPPGQQIPALQTSHGHLHREPLCRSVVLQVCDVFSLPLLWMWPFKAPAALYCITWAGTQRTWLSAEGQLDSALCCDLVARRVNEMLIVPPGWWNVKLCLAPTSLFPHIYHMHTHRITHIFTTCSSHRLSSSHSVPAKIPRSLPLFFFCTHPLTPKLFYLWCCFIRGVTL